MPTQSTASVVNKSTFIFLGFVMGINLLLAGCAALPKQPAVIDAKDFNKNIYNKIGLLVVRVGGVSYFGNSPIPVLFTRDYSKRIPEATYALGIPSAKDDVYIEGERLHEAIPTYPKFKLSPGIEFYKNITPRIYQTVSDALRDKGYVVSDVNKIALERGKLISEMKVDDIAALSMDSVDALLVFHYMDIGNMQQPLSKGFTKLIYTFTLFDTRTKAGLLFFKSSVNIFTTVQSDNDIKNDPELMKKIHYNEANNVVRLDFSEEELIGYFMKYLRVGSFEYGERWDGLNNIIP